MRPAGRTKKKASTGADAGRGFLLNTVFPHLPLVMIRTIQEQDLAPVPRVTGAVAKASQGLIPLPFSIRDFLTIQGTKCKKKALLEIPGRATHLFAMQHEPFTRKNRACCT